MDAMQIYNYAREVPTEAKRTIAGGKLKGFTDINPMWRIRVLTELFGPCGFGWKVVSPRYWTEPGASGEVMAYCELGLSYVLDGNWSDPVMGIGGAMAVSSNKNGLQSSDEAYKGAYTDAISVCCKMLGIGASVYWERGETKYSNSAKEDSQPREKQPAPGAPQWVCAVCGGEIKAVVMKDRTMPPEEIAQKSTKKYGKPVCMSCAYKINGNQG